MASAGVREGCENAWQAWRGFEGPQALRVARKVWMLDAVNWRGKGATFTGNAHFQLSFFAGAGLLKRPIATH